MPLNSTENLPNAGLIKRLLALTYDSFILLALSMAYGTLATAVMVALGSNAEDEFLPMQNGSWFGIGWTLFIGGFYWFFYKRAGQTVGMRAWRLKVIGRNGNKPSHLQCLIRIAIAPLSFALFGLGYFWCLFNEKKAAWQDLASETRVVVMPKEKGKSDKR